MKSRSLFEKLDPSPQEDDSQQLSGHIIRVAFESAADTEFDYLVPDDLWPVQVGQRVQVPFGKSNKLQTGFCVETLQESLSDKVAEQQRRKKNFRLKKVGEIIDKEPLIDTELMELARWICDYYVCPLGQVLAAMVPAAVKRGAGVQTQRSVYLSVEPDEIEKTLSGLRGKKQKQIIEKLKSLEAFDTNSALELQGLTKIIRSGEVEEDSGFAGNSRAKLFDHNLPGTGSGGPVNGAGIITPMVFSNARHTGGVFKDRQRNRQNRLRAIHW